MKAKLWLAQFTNEEEAFEFAMPTYNDDGDPACHFWRDIATDYIDTDFQEVVFDDWRDYLAEIGCKAVSNILARMENTLILVFERENDLSSMRNGQIASYVGEYELSI